MITIGLMSHSPHITGAEKMLFNLALLFKNDPAIKPLLLIPQPSQGPLAQEAQRHGIPWIEIPHYRWYIFKPLDDPSLFDAYCRGIGEPIAEIRRILMEHRVDLVFNNTLTCITGLLAAVGLNLPAVTWVHGIIDSYLVDNYDAVYRMAMDRAVIQLSQKIICNSYWTQRFFNRYAAQKSVMIHNWTAQPETTAEFDESTTTFVCLNTFDTHKGVGTLIEAAKILKDRRYTFQIDLYGEGGDKTKLLHQTESLALSEIIHFKGRTTEISKVYHSCLALVQPSYIEPFGMTLIEAMAQQRAVIACMSGGPEEIIRDGVNGLIIESGDAEQLANKMAYLLDHKWVARDMGIAGFQTYRESFNPTIAKPQFSVAIKDALETFKGYTEAQRLIFDLVNWVHYR